MEQRIMDKEYFVKKVLEDRQEAKKQKISKQKRLDSEYLSYVSERKTKRIKRQRSDPQNHKTIRKNHKRSTSPKTRKVSNINGLRN